ncbi:DUF4440 domain-containing protein [Microbacterium sp. X-17]|uniref:nuclear transport factor 2 family protein n=1 Tax=Microbacterium sp. X-17 TaxID=3144404 RepID=UPI0031F4A405
MAAPPPDPERLVIEAERRLLDPLVRSDVVELSRLLAPSFREIGRSGTVWNRDAIIAALAADPGVPEGRMDDILVDVLAPQLYLLLYSYATPSEVVRRASVWRMTARGPRMVFHQGTPVHESLS